MGRLRSARRKGPNPRLIVAIIVTVSVANAGVGEADPSTGATTHSSAHRTSPNGEEPKAGSGEQEIATAEHDGDAARRAFDQGYELSQDGDFPAAARQFERAYRLKPRASVLYNLGQALAASGDARRAALAFSKFLRESDPSADVSLRDRAKSALQVVNRYIGELLLTVSPPDGRVFIDGHEVEAMNGPIALSAGSHVVRVERQGYEKHVESVEVVGRDLVEREIYLAQSVSRSYLQLECDVPQMSLLVDGEEPFQLGRKLFAISAGRHSLELFRAGYARERIELNAEEERAYTMACEARPDSAAPASAFGTVRMQLLPTVADAVEVWVDGHPNGFSVARSGQQLNLLLPTGPHDLGLFAPNREPWSGHVEVPSNQTTTLAPDLPLSRARVAELTAARLQRETWSNIAIGVGAALATVARVFALRAVKDNEEWKSSRRRLQEAHQDDPDAWLLSQRSQRAALRLQRSSDTAVGLGAASTVVLCGGFGFRWFTSPEEPQRREQSNWMLEFWSTM